MGISQCSSKREVDTYLKEKYGLRLDTFLYSLNKIAAFHHLVILGRSVSNLEREIQNIEAQKLWLLKSLKRFLDKTGQIIIIERKIKKRWSAIPDNRKDKIIIEEFNLKGKFDFIENQISYIRKKIVLFRGLGKAAAESRRFIEPITLASLVWARALRKNKTTSYKDIELLFVWISNNRKKEMRKLFGRQFIVTAKDIYIANIRYYKKYSDLVSILESESFSDFDPDEISEIDERY